ncbi:hypothetical protein C2E23DRAFT_403047 [Lenzites betulinus]|nr:hypothetical protein C2E23DRAFT_403047 [Lenzites betulinus]
MPSLRATVALAIIAQAIVVSAAPALTPEDHSPAVVHAHALAPDSTLSPAVGPKSALAPETLSPTVVHAPTVDPAVAVVPASVLAADFKPVARATSGPNNDISSFCPVQDLNCRHSKRLLNVPDLKPATLDGST